MLNVVKKTESIRDYHASEPISRSKLMKLEETPAKFKYLMDNPEKPTEALLLGQAFHKLVLEPEDFENEIKIEPCVNKRTKEGKAVIAEFHEEFKDKTIVTLDMCEKAGAMAESVLSNPRAKAMLKSGDIEKSYYWVDSLNGETVKCRPDTVITKNSKGIISDLKSCLHADSENFRKDSIKHGYDVQAYMCKTAVEKLTGIPHDFYFICVEKEPPYLVNIFKADDLVLEHGKRRYRELLGIYHECKVTNNWYGYMGFADIINELNLPAYILKEFQ